MPQQISKSLYLFFVPLVYLMLSCQSTPEADNTADEPMEAIIDAGSIEFGISTDDLITVKGIIQRNQFLADILLNYSVPYAVIHDLAQRSKDVYDVRKLASGRPYTIYCSKDSLKTAQCFIYQPNDLEYVVYDFRGDSVNITVGQKPITLVDKIAEGKIKTSLYDALKEDGNNILLAFEMADIYAWTIDFYRLQKEDYFKILYTERQVEGKFIGIDQIHAVLFQHEGRDFYAYYFEQDSTGSDFFDDAAESLRKAFLKSPLKYSRLTSGFTNRRFHPVQKRWKAHLGTDYAAPQGTPILATGDGKVVEAQYKKFNGNYVKIKHNSVYNTQYLHMSKINPGIKPGVYVKQGDIIGFVGSTGLATGPHVCYRFWKNGSQVNHLKEEFPPSEPVRRENIPQFYEHIAPLHKELNSGITPA